MWLSRQRGQEKKREPASQTGAVTAECTRPSIYLEGERREVPVYGPGGYFWRPRNGQQVLVLKAGSEREQDCIIGCQMETEGMSPGEVRITSGAVELRLGTDGRVALTGKVLINGVELTELVRQTVASMVG